ncbi:hypothetical protein GQ457_18G004280 [Hibiscus cannabinus]
MLRTKPDIEVFSGRHKRHPWSQQLKSSFNSLEDLDHPLPLDFRSTCMRRMKRFRLLEEIRSRVLNGIVHALKDYITSDGRCRKDTGGVRKNMIRD